MKDIEAIIFDFDGVILDSANIKTEAFLELFKNYPAHQQAIKEYHIENQGITRYKKFEWIYKELLDKPYNKEIKNKLGSDFSALVFEKIMETDAIPGAMEFLESLRNNIPAYIASGTPDKELHKIINNRNLSKYFKAAYGSDISKEEAIDRVVELESVEYSELLFIGDATTDYLAASARDVPFIAVYSEEMEEYWKRRGIEPVHNLMKIYERTERLIVSG
ncbi:MAG: HAD-IA family hydrolase [Balneolaceae bacterium]|nr:HAD-IA family hydrolase [Balneolaceae bacterium]